jgi:hypothetical protein
MRITLPSARNVEIYHRLEEDGASIRDVAEEFWLSPTRIGQIRGQVHRWYRNSAPDPEDRYRRQHAVAACKWHQTRSGRMYGRMMDAFRDSQGEERRSREVDGRLVTTTRMNYGEGKYCTLALRYSREQRDAALLLARLGDEYFVPPDVEYVQPTEDELKLEAEEDRPRLQAEAEHSDKAKRYFADMAEYMSRSDEAEDDGEELDDDDFAPDEEQASPGRVCAPETPAEPAAAATVAMPPRATAVDDGTLDVAEILRQQSRHDRRKKITPVQPTPANEEKRRALAAKLFGT